MFTDVNIVILSIVEEEKMRCEGWRRTCDAFSLGPAKWEQCSNEAIVNLEVKQDGKLENLPGCQTCWNEAKERGIEIISAKPITVKVTGCGAVPAIHVY